MKYIFIILVLFVLWACSTTKNIPEGQYLLNDFSIKSDNKNIDVSSLEDYVRQKPNTTLPVFGKVRLMFYNLAGQDTSKWINRKIRQLGQAPVIYSARQTEVTAEQLEKELSNQGYLNAEVDTVIKAKDKKVNVRYEIHTGEPYRIRDYEYTLGDSVISRIASRLKRFSEVKTDILFDKEVLEEERVRLSNILRNLGYYNFSKENLYYKADTTLNSHQVDLFLSLRELPGDSVGFHRYNIRNVTILSGYDPASSGNRWIFRNPDTTYHDGIAIIHGRNNFLRNSMLLRNNYIQPGRFYSDMAITRTYTAFSTISAIKQTNIDLIPVITEDSLYFVDAQITLAPGNIHWFQASLDGTNSAGDIGIAPSVAYQHQNLFNGAEILQIRLKGAYEFITGEKDANQKRNSYYEYGIDASLSFPQFLFPWLKRSWREIPSASTQISVGLTNQHRNEYTRQFFNLGYTFRWNSKRNQLSHALDLIDVNYIRMPWTSTSFDSTLTARPVLKAAYDNQLIARSGYNVTYTIGSSNRRYPRNTYIIRGGVDIAGWLPRIVQSLGGAKKNADGRYEIAGIAYAEYLKADISFSQTRNFNRTKSFAYHIGLGVGDPFGNSDILPYERRYFSGGANSLRGWYTRRLGPGSYQPNDSTSFINQAGDIKLDLNAEYRNKITDMFEIAVFIDAGNIWTIKSYEGQEGGVFKFNKFYKEIAVSYGLGLRLDLDFLLLRLDGGMKAYDPGRAKDRRFVLHKANFGDNFAWHFAIGYPF